MKKWEPKTLSPALQDGIDAHLLAATPVLDRNILARVSPRAKVLAKRFESMAKDYELYDWFEQYQRVNWRGFTLRRIMDAGGLWRPVDVPPEVPVLLDYKSANWPWKTENGITSKALGFQTTMYLIPPSQDKDLGPFDVWPSTMDYLVAADRGPDAVFRAERNEADETNLEQAITMVAEAKAFPKNQGWLCAYCPFFDMCYATEGWKKKYQPRSERAKPVLELAE